MTITTTPTPTAPSTPTSPPLPSRSLPTPVSVKQFTFGVTLGIGSFGRVKFATHRPTSTPWAIKILKKSEVVRLSQIEHIMNEKHIMSQLNHPFIVKQVATFQSK